MKRKGVILKKVLILFFTMFAFIYIYGNDLANNSSSAVGDSTTDITKEKTAKDKKLLKKEAPSVTLNSDVKIFYESLNNYIGMDFIISLITPDYIVRGTLLKVYDDGLLILIAFPKKEIFVNKNVISCIEFKRQ